MSKNNDYLPKLRWQITSCITSIALGLSMMLQFSFADPEWWSTPETVGGDVPIQADVESNHFAAGNLGQVKNMVKHAAEHFAVRGIKIPAESQAMLDLSLIHI